MEQQFKYFAFISYNSHDTEWGKRVQRKLEHYRISTTLCTKHRWERTPIKPVFLAPTDIQPEGLSEELQERLRASRNLIVNCSPNSVRSEWVGKEIDFFHQLVCTSQIHFFIDDGQPHSGNPTTECFNPIVEGLTLDNETKTDAIRSLSPPSESSVSASSLTSVFPDIPHSIIKIVCA